MPTWPRASMTNPEPERTTDMAKIRKRIAFSIAMLVCSLICVIVVARNGGHNVLTVVSIALAALSLTVLLRARHAARRMNRK